MAFDEIQLVDCHFKRWFLWSDNTLSYVVFSWSDRSWQTNRSSITTGSALYSEIVQSKIVCEWNSLVKTIFVSTTAVEVYLLLGSIYKSDEKKWKRFERPEKKWKTVLFKYLSFSKCDKFKRGVADWGGTDCGLRVKLWVWHPLDIDTLTAKMNHLSPVFIIFYFSWPYHLTLAT